MSVMFCVQEAAHALVVDRGERVRDEARRIACDRVDVVGLEQPLAQRVRRPELGDALHQRRPRIRKFCWMNSDSPRAMRSLLRGMIAVCGIGRLSGRRNSATTANQSASAPIIAASLKAAR